MSKSRQKNQQIGFWDTEVTNPDHDAVCLWAYQNAEQILHKAYPEYFDRFWNDEDVESSSRLAEPSSTLQDALATFIQSNPRPNPRITGKTLEYVLKSYTGAGKDIERIVGYADLVITAVFPSICLKYKDSNSSYSNRVFDGYELGWSDSYRPLRVLVEAKSVLPTVGDLMRQIQLYRTAFSGRFVVVSPDERYSQILSEQGVLFVQYVAADSN